MDLLASLDEVLQHSDVLCVAATHRPNEAPLIGSRELSRLSRGGVLVNVARGALVDENALEACLTSGHLAAAGLDVQAIEQGVSRFARLPNVIMTPHLGASTVSVQEEIGARVVRAVREVLGARDELDATGGISL